MSHSPLEDPYVVLGLEKSASYHSIQNAHRMLSKQLHSDRNPGHEEKGAKESQKVEEAFQTLMHPAKKARLDPYAALGLTSDADDAAIKKAFRILVKKWHPDRNDASRADECMHAFQVLQQAYEILSDQQSRSKHDHEVQLGELRKKRAPKQGWTVTTEPRQEGSRSELGAWADRARENADESLPANVPFRNSTYSNYYRATEILRTNETPVRRRSSARSNASSANRSLRDGRRGSFDHGYQQPNFARRRAGSASSYEIARDSPKFPPKPKASEFSSHRSQRHIDDGTTERERVRFEFASPSSSDSVNQQRRRNSSARKTPEQTTPSNDRNAKPTQSTLRGTSDAKPPKPASIGNATRKEQQSTRRCYLCNANVSLQRKKDWQRHVTNDLKPYQCLEDPCPAWDVTYRRLNELQKHYAAFHYTARIFKQEDYHCMFCEDDLSFKSAPLGRSKANTRTETDRRFEHIARHLEENAFSVIPRQHQDWQFYSDSSSSRTGVGLDPTQGRSNTPAGRRRSRIPVSSAKRDKLVDPSLSQQCSLS